MLRSVVAGGLVVAVCAPASGSAGAPERRLPTVSTFATVGGLPRDSGADKVPEGVVVHPVRAALVHERPEGRAVAVLPVSQLGGPTWVPVVETVPGWRRVLLPSRPNRSTGWIRDAGLESARSPFLVRLRLDSRKLTLYRFGKAVRTWRVAVGKRGTPTPQGRTFLLANLATSRSGTVLPLGIHSTTLDTFGGGPGTVAFHGWPDRKVFGKAVSHGCVRVPPGALKALASVPLGSPVLITSSH